MLSAYSYADCNVLSFKEIYLASSRDNAVFCIKGVALETHKYGRTIKVIEDLKGNFTGESSIFVWGNNSPHFDDSIVCIINERSDHITQYQENDTLIMLVAKATDRCGETSNEYQTMGCAYSILKLSNGFVTGPITWGIKTIPLEELHSLLNPTKCNVLSFKENYAANSQDSAVFFIKGVALETREYGRKIKVIEDLKGNFTGESSILVWGSEYHPFDTLYWCIPNERPDTITQYPENDTLIMLVVKAKYNNYCIENPDHYGTMPCGYSVLKLSDGFVTGSIFSRRKTTISLEELHSLLNPTKCNVLSFKKNYLANFQNDEVLFIKGEALKSHEYGRSIKVIEDLKGNFTGESSIFVWGSGYPSDDSVGCMPNLRVDHISLYQENDTLIMLAAKAADKCIETSNEYQTIACARSILQFSNGFVTGCIMGDREISTISLEELYSLLNHTGIQAVVAKNNIYQWNGTIFFENPEDKVIKLSFYDLSGKLVHDAVTTSYNYRPVLTSGIFICRINIAGKLQTIKYIAP